MAYCNYCKNSSPKGLIKGNGWIEFILYLFYIIPGVIYSIWRRSGEPSVCPICRKDGLVTESPAKAETSRNEVDCPFCAEKILATAKICKHCGKDIAESKQAIEDQTSVNGSRIVDHEPSEYIYKAKKQTGPSTGVKVFLGIVGLIVLVALIGKKDSSPDNSATNNSKQNFTSDSKPYIKKGQLFCISEDQFDFQFQLLGQGIKKYADGCGSTTDDIPVVIVDVGFTKVKARSVVNGQFYWVESESIGRH